MNNIKLFLLNGYSNYNNLIGGGSPSPRSIENLSRICAGQQPNSYKMSLVFRIQYNRTSTLTRLQK